MTRLLTLVALGLAVALAPTRGEAQVLVPDYWGLLEQDQDGDGFITQKDFALNPGLAQQTKACRLSPNYKNLPQEDKTKLNTLYNLSLHKTNKKVPGQCVSNSTPKGCIKNAVQARNDFLKKHPGLKIDPAGC